MPPQSPATMDPPPDINSVAPTTGQRVLRGAASLIGGGGGQAAMAPIDAAIAKENDRRLAQAKMYRGLAAQIATALHLGIDPKTQKPLTPEQEQEMQHQYEAAWAAYEKAAGVSKDTKTALGRGKAIVEHIINAGRASRQGQQTDQGGGGGGQPAATPGGGMSAPPKFDVDQATLQVPAMQAETAQSMALGQNEAVVNQRKQFARDAGLKEGSLGYQEYVLTGKMPPQAHLQKAVFQDPKTKQIMEGSYDPSEGTYKDQQGNTVEGALPATASMLTPKPFKYMSPDGKLLPGFQIGMSYTDMEGNPLPAGTELYQRGLLPTETLRQVITYDGAGNPILNTLKTTRTPTIPGTTTPPASGAPGAAKPAGGGMTPPPKPDGSASATAPGQARDATGKPLGSSASMVNQQQKKVTAVREANTQLFGDPTNPTLTPLKDFSDLADNAESRKRIGTALQFTFEELEGDAKAHGTLAALISASSGIQPAIANAQARVRRNILDAMTPREREAYNATISAFSSVVALRSLTSASAAQFSVKALERDIPTIGLNTTTSKDFNEKLGRIGEIAYNGTKQINDQVMPKSERDYYKKQLDSLKSGAPRAGTHVTDNEIMKAIQDVKRSASAPAKSAQPN